MQRKNPQKKCASCGKQIDLSTDAEFRPFCSKRCQMVDLGKWFKEEYSIQASTNEEIIEETTDENNND